MRIAIYTAICGGYDLLKAPPEELMAAAAAAGDCDWIAFGDGELPEDRGWQTRRIAAMPGSARLRSRHAKILPLAYLDGYDVAIWIDGSVRIKAPEFVSMMVESLQGQPLACFDHPRRDCIYDEAVAAANFPKYAGDDLLGQVAAYRAEGFPERAGLAALTLFAWDLRHPLTPRISEQWWQETLRWGAMDQLSLPVVLWRLGTTWASIQDALFNSQYFGIWQHTGTDEVRLNLGCADQRLPGYVNVDIWPGPDVDVVTDLRERWPWPDSSVHGVMAADVIEHLPDAIHTMNELYRVLADHGVAEIIVPSTDGPGAFQDPTHVSFWNRNSFRYYTAGDPYRERFAKIYGITAAFGIGGERVLDTLDGPKVQIALVAEKRTRGRDGR